MSSTFRSSAHCFLCTTFVLAIAFSPAHAQSLPSQPVPSHSDPVADKLVDDLIQRMTLDEKLGQISQNAYKEPDTVSHDDRVKNEQVGSFLFLKDPKEMDRLQHLAVEHTRLHIPLVFGFDVIHGYRTIYPVPIAMAASWDPAVPEKAQAMAAHEAASQGIRWAFGPMVDIARDPRWGRMMEGAGEDPFLGSAMAAAQIRGFQGTAPGDPQGMIPADSIMACVKHFAGYGAALGGRDYSESNISDEQLWNVYLPPFRAAIEAGSASLMSAYMDLNGVPATGNYWLLHNVLRDDWHFQGMVVSDWFSIKSQTNHGFAKDDEDAAVRSIKAGVDMEMTSTVYRDELAAAIKSGLVDTATLDQAVRYILHAKYRLGLFQHPYTSPELASVPLVNPEQRAAARAAGARTAVLLRNEGSVLPLKKTGTIALIGPLANSKTSIMGSWSLAGNPTDSVTVLDGLKNKLGASATINYTVGVEIERGPPSIFDDQFPEPKPTITTQAGKDAEFAKAIDLIKHSDVAVLALGELENMSGEAASRASLSLPGKQEELLEAAVATGKPIVLLLLNARPLDITWANDHVPGILEAWYPGTEGGNAIADVLFGDAVPGGKLPFSWPRNVGQIPVNYAQNETQDPDSVDRRYWDETSRPLYPFGYGLSYTTFTLGQPTLSAATMPATGSLDATFAVTNSGQTDGDEVVQLYTHQRYGSASRPRRELKAFERIHLKAGETRNITLHLPAASLGFWSPQTHHWSVEPSTFDLWLGNNSNATLHTTFTVTP